MWPLPPKNTKTNSYISLILSDDVEYKEHKWTLESILNRKFDVFHIHWPETYLNHTSLIKKIVFSFLVIIYLIYIKIIRKKIIWTVHNIRPHEDTTPKISGLFYFLLNKFIDSYIFMTNSSKEEFYSTHKIKKEKKHSIIPHPLYKSKVRMNREKNNDILFFGLIRPYKKVFTLIDEYKKTIHNGNLIILGNCTPSDRNKLGKEKNNDNRISLELGFYEEAKLDQLLSISHGVIIPYKNITNSGVLFKAISMNAHILLPKLKYTQEVLENLNYKNYLFFENEVTTEALNKFFHLKKTYPFILNIDNYNNHIVESHRIAYLNLLKKN